MFLGGSIILNLKTSKQRKKKSKYYTIDIRLHNEKYNLPFYPFGCHLDLTSGCRPKGTIYWALVQGIKNTMQEGTKLCKVLSSSWHSYWTFNRTFQHFVRVSAPEEEFLLISVGAASGWWAVHRILPGSPPHRMCTHSLSSTGRGWDGAGMGPH